MIHYDPVIVGDELLDEVRNLVLSLLQQQDSRLTIHDFRMVQGKGHTNLIFDVALPDDLKGKEKAIKKALDEALAEQSTITYYTVITFDPQAFNME